MGFGKVQAVGGQQEEESFIVSIRQHVQRQRCLPVTVAGVSLGVLQAKRVRCRMPERPDKDVRGVAPGSEFPQQGRVVKEAVHGRQREIVGIGLLGKLRMVHGRLYQRQGGHLPQGFLRNLQGIVPFFPPQVSPLVPGDGREIIVGLRDGSGVLDIVQAERHAGQLWCGDTEIGSILSQGRIAPELVLPACHRHGGYRNKDDKTFHGHNLYFE